jgi:hypothetical protein
VIGDNPGSLRKALGAPDGDSLELFVGMSTEGGAVTGELQ